VVITLSTYTEPPPQVTPVLSELPQSYDPQEDSELSEFAQLLNGMIQENENGKESEEAGDVQSESLSAVELDALNGAKLGAEKLNLFGEQEDEKVSKANILKDQLSQEKLTETEFPEDQLNVLLSAENLLTRVEPAVSDEGSDEFSREISNVKLTDNLTELQPQTELSSTMTDNADADADALAQSASLKAQETLTSEAKGKKDRAQIKSEDVQAPAPEKSRAEELASIKTAPEKESRGKLDETRKAGKNRDKVSFEVRDLRTGAGAETPKDVNIRVNAGADTGRVPGSTVRDITLELRLPEQGQSSAQTTWEAKAGSALENMLARELHQNFNGDIVRHASMALRDGGEGTIRLALKPESLGNVKIHLEMTENKITGHIVVESEEALNAFRKEIASLEQAFRDSGFTNADLNLSMTADGRNAQGREQEASSPLPKMAASRYDDSLSDSADQPLFPIVDVFFGRKQGAVNVLA
jgi:flagellar hook-length control protein FliK